MIRMMLMNRNNLMMRSKRKTSYKLPKETMFNNRKRQELQSLTIPRQALLLEAPRLEVLGRYQTPRISKKRDPWLMKREQIRWREDIRLTAKRLLLWSALVLFPKQILIRGNQKDFRDLEALWGFRWVQLEIKMVKGLKIQILTSLLPDLQTKADIYINIYLHFLINY